MEQKNYRGSTCRKSSVSAVRGDPDAERAVLACVLLDPRCIGAVSQALELEDFTGEANRIVYAAMLRLHAASKPIDVTLLVGALREAGEYNTVDGVSANTLLELYRLFPMVRNLDQYVDRVVEMSRRPNAIKHSD